MIWTADLAYAVGLIATDGSLSNDGRHIDLTSKDKDQLETFIRLLNLKCKVGLKRSSYNTKGTYFRIQFSNVRLYRFLCSIGIRPNKTKTIGKVTIPDKFFADFLRGNLDGDGCTYSYLDPRWKNSFMLYTAFSSASLKYLEWLRDQIKKLYVLEGKITFQGKSTFQLRYAKKGSIILIEKMYYKENLPALSRKRLKVFEALGIIQKNAGVAKLVHAID